MHTLSLLWSKSQHLSIAPLYNDCYPCTYYYVGVLCIVAEGGHSSSYLTGECRSCSHSQNGGDKSRSGWDEAESRAGSLHQRVTCKSEAFTSNQATYNIVTLGNYISSLLPTYDQSDLRGTVAVKSRLHTVTNVYKLMEISLVLRSKLWLLRLLVNMDGIVT